MSPLAARLTYLHTELPNQLDHQNLALRTVLLSTVCYLILILAAAGLSFYAAEPWLSGVLFEVELQVDLDLVADTLDIHFHLVSAGAKEASMLVVKRDMADS